MALEKFWNNVFSGTYTPPNQKDSKSAFVQALENNDLWEVRSFIEGFDPNDISFLEDETIEKIQTLVKQIRSTVGKAISNPETPLDANQKNLLVNSFREIVSILQPEKYWKAENFTIQSILDRRLRPKLSKWIEGFSFETDTTHTGEEIVRITLRYTPDAVPQDDLNKERSRIRLATRGILMSAGLTRSPVISLRETAPTQLQEVQA